MPRVFALFCLCVIFLPLPAAAASLPNPSSLNSREAVIAWIWAYRAKPQPAAVPAAMRAASRLGVFQDTESAGVFVGFMAGVIAANPKSAPTLIARTLPLPPQDQWFMVRAIAWSGARDWRRLMTGAADGLSARQVMIDKHLAGKLPTLDDLVFEDDPGWFARATEAVRIDRLFAKPPEKPVRLEPNPDVIDTLWGYHFGSRSYAPLARIIAMLPWAQDRDHLERLTLGNMAKYTLALNAARAPELLKTLRWAATQPHRDGAVAVLGDALMAAETADTARLRREALAAIEELRQRGPYSRRNVAWWGRVGESAISLGCLGAAVTGQVQLGLPCVLGGAITSAGLRWWSTRE